MRKKKSKSNSFGVSQLAGVLQEQAPAFQKGP
jgi:hypothetical protein